MALTNINKIDISMVRPKPTAAASHSVKIVIIDDDPMLSDMYSRKLKEEGYSVFAASNGEEGVKLIQSEKPDLVLLDIVMPDGDGFFVLDKLKADKDSQSIPVIMLTNLSSIEDREESSKRGAVDYFTKAENTPTQLAEKIKKILKS